ncbi:MAG: hypothetical protein KF768_09855 [Phycisphaeraceae bacterium]|nr:hypothetical protein [Phycisphaeraceae bacterium]
MSASQPPTRHVHETPAMHDPADAWHDHAHDEKPQQSHGEIHNAGKIILTGVALFMVIVVAVVAIYGFYMHQITSSLTRRERASSVGPAADARTFQMQSKQIQAKGGQVESINAEGVLFDATHADFTTASEAVRREYLGPN